MDKILIDLITLIVSSADTSINWVFNSLMELCFMAEKSITKTLGIDLMAFDQLKMIILSMSISLIILKFLKKGFDIYILWTEGEADTPPLTFLVYFIRAMVTALSFTFLYDWLIEIAIDFGTLMLNSLNLSNPEMPLTASLTQIASMSIFNSFIAIILLILLIVLYVQFLMRSAEIFVLKLGFPLACVGLVQADGGVFNSYRDKLFKSVLTVLVQILLCKLGIALIYTMQYLNAIAIIILAIKTPRFLQEFMLGGGTGGISNIIINASKAMEFSGQIKRKLTQLKKAG